jgi:hypothetical protein
VALPNILFNVVSSLIEISISPELFTIASEGSRFLKGEFDNDNSNVAPGVPVPIILYTPVILLPNPHITIFFGGKRVFVGAGGVGVGVGGVGVGFGAGGVGVGVGLGAGGDGV